MIRVVLWLLSAGLLASGFADGLEHMVGNWSREEYSHGYMIPLVALLLAWQRMPRLAAVPAAGHWLGVVLLLLSLCTWVLGELSSLYTILQYGFLLGLYGLVLALLGLYGMRLMMAPLAYLLFMVPLPNFLLFNLSQQLQLLSSQIGVAVVRAFDVSVHLEGNVIDLGVYKLQVVEACSGLNYLFPLMSFGFLLACLYRAPFWQRAVLFLSTAPITILMNSFRIGVIGVLVDRYGIAQAEGFLHYFEGWVIFMACVAVLLLEIWCFNRIHPERPGVFASLDLDFPAWSTVRAALADGACMRPQAGPVWACLVLVTLFLPLSWGLGARDEQPLAREGFVHFPLIQGEWVGREVSIDPEVLASLRLTDHFIADYRAPGVAEPVNFYVAFYGSQRKGASVHSPKSCIPGGGWEIQAFGQVSLPGVALAGGPLRVNRVLIQMGEQRQLVYYWFQQRGRSLTNEYLVKWYIFTDALFMNRTDGALVRVTTPVPDGGDIAGADQRLERFVDEVYPLLQRYVPD